MFAAAAFLFVGEVVLKSKPNIVCYKDLDGKVGSSGRLGIPESNIHGRALPKVKDHKRVIKRTYNADETDEQRDSFVVFCFGIHGAIILDVCFRITAIA